MRSILQPVFAGVLAAFMACQPTKAPSAPGAEYTAKITACAATGRTPAESCYCRKAVDIEYKVCEHPEWHLGRCESECK